MPLEASLAAATRKAADASALAARASVKAGSPLTEAAFYPSEEPARPTAPPPPPPSAQEQSVVQGAQVLLPRGSGKRAAAK